MSNQGGEHKYMFQHLSSKYTATRSTRYNKDFRKTIFWSQPIFNIVCSLTLIIKHNQSLEGVPAASLRVKSLEIKNL